MKRFIGIFALLLFVALSYAQNGRPQTVTASEADTNKNAETDYIYIPNAGGFVDEVNLNIQVLCTDDYGGTSDGEITIQGSQDGTSYVNITDDSFTDMVGDSATIVDAAVLEWVIPRTYHYKYRLQVIGTSGDTTLLTPKYRVQDIK